jgi:hypothetical protein
MRQRVNVAKQIAGLAIRRFMERHNIDSSVVVGGSGCEAAESTGCNLEDAPGWW